MRERVSHGSWMSALCAYQPCKVKAAVSSTGQLVEAVCAVCSLRSFRQQEFLKKPTTAKVSPALPCQSSSANSVRLSQAEVSRTSHFLPCCDVDVSICCNAPPTIPLATNLSAHQCNLPCPHPVMRQLHDWHALRAMRGQRRPQQWCDAAAPPSFPAAVHVKAQAWHRKTLPHDAPPQELWRQGSGALQEQPQ